MDEASYDQQPESRGAGRSIGWILGTLSAAWLLYLMVVSIAADPGQTGFVLGYVTAYLVIALAIRWVYMRLRSEASRPRFWSPWIPVIAAAVLLIARLGSGS
jgi:Na+/melibiose symporter-like transporter